MTPCEEGSRELVAEGALGPYAAGEVISRWGYTGLEGLVLAGGVLSFALALPAVLALRRAPLPED